MYLARVAREGLTERDKGTSHENTWGNNGLGYRTASTKALRQACYGRGTQRGYNDGNRRNRKTGSDISTLCEMETSTGF